MRSLYPTDWSSEYRDHLLNRAGFGISLKTNIPKDSQGPQGWVERLLDVPPSLSEDEMPPWTREPTPDLADFRRIRQMSEEERQRERRRIIRKSRQNLQSTQSWWLERMQKTPHPLQEKMTLFWHGHFVSSDAKVRSALCLWNQNQLFRSQGLGSFEDLTIAIGRDPAMLLYLDGSGSTKKAPNENYARELMELFTLGEGHYTEDDIRAAARAFTGWRARRFNATADFSKVDFDSEEKHFFGKSGNFNDKDIVKLILSKDQAARYLVTKLWTYFAYAQPETEIVDALAATLKRNNFLIKPVLRELFLAEPFYSRKALRTQIKSPVVWLVGLADLLDFNPFPYALGDRISTLLGQELFNPPSVKGWDGGRTWVSTSTLILRNNLASMLLLGGQPGEIGLGMRGIDDLPPAALEAMPDEMKKRLAQRRQSAANRTVPSLLYNESLTRAWKEAEPDSRFSLLARTCFRGPVSPASLDSLAQNCQSALHDGSSSALRQTLKTFTTHPEYQLI